MGICSSNRGERAADRGVATLLLALLLLLALTGLPGVARAADPVATGARVGGDEVRTRFVADLTESVSYSVYVLPDPYRVIIDLPGVTFDLPPGTGLKTRGLIKEYRYGQVEEGRARIVMDTNGPVLIEKSFIVEPQAGQPARIVVDLVGTTKETFEQTYRSEEKASTEAVAEAAAEMPADEPAALAEEAPARATQVAEASEDTAPHAEEPSAAATEPPTDTRRRIVIDPGHGGIDPGAIGLNKTREKDVVLAFAESLSAALNATGQYEVILTRSDDRFVSLKERVHIARENRADLFIAIHADTVRGQTARGATIYTLSDKASDAEAEALAQKENRADLIGGVEFDTENEAVTDILIDLVQRESKNHSLLFAKKAVVEMRSATGFTGKPMRSAGFVVLKAPDVPSVLIELGYLSSKTDEGQLNSPEWRDRVAKAMARAVDKYFATEVAVRAE